MTIKQQGGIFGRNPSFNEVTVDTLSSPAVDLQSNGVADFKKYISITDTNVRINMLETDTTDLNTQLRNQAGNFEVRTLADDLASGTTRLQINHTSGDVAVSTGNLVIGTSGKGIDFSATSGTGTSELFDDYEEGTWTPTVTSTSGTITTVDNVEGFYTKIGRQVTVYAHVTTTNNGTGAGNLRFTGLPYTPVSTSMSATGFMGVGYNSSSGKLLRGRITGGNLRIDVSNDDGSYPTSNGRSNSIQVTYYVS